MENLTESLLKQQVEFLHTELEQTKQKALNHHKLNESLMSILGKNDETLINSQMVKELQKTTELQRKEIQDLKLRHKDQILDSEKEKNLILLNQRELEFEVKQQKMTFEAEKLEFFNKLQKLEAEKTLLIKEKKSYENNLNQIQNLQNYQFERKVKELQNEIDSLKNEHEKELKKIKEDSEESLQELKKAYDIETGIQKQTILELQGKVKGYNIDIKRIKEKNNAQILRIQVEKLENSVDYYKSLSLGGSQRVSNERDDFRSICSDALGSKDSITRSGRSFFGINEDFDVFQKKLQGQEEKFTQKIDNLHRELKKNKEDKDLMENNLKNEIKFLIGKLLKAKSKLTAEGELTGLIRRESMVKCTGDSQKYGKDRIPSWRRV
ncbi:hypothetical protein SteCoe_10823 [Stentor coeruleus]|uniref:Uncharacterized protein n=1 Tax=Stentor coeruleus TaxID=5963 RepID=A0A1R2CEN6_9CILI|nr:hypothetical protein SteCoe_10823 [Stentor coeruleus]